MYCKINNMLQYFEDKNLLLKSKSNSSKSNSLAIREARGDQALSKITICLSFIMVLLVVSPALGSVAMGNTDI